MDTTYPSNNNVIPQARYISTPEVLLDGQFAPSSCDINGNTNQNLATQIAWEDLVNDRMKIECRGTNTYISTATTTVVKTGAWHLHTVTVNGWTAGTIIAYDNTAASGTILFSFDSTNALSTYTFDIQFNIGLTIVTSAATKITISYR